MEFIKEFGTLSSYLQWLLGCYLIARYMTKGHWENLAAEGRLKRFQLGLDAEGGWQEFEGRIYRLVRSPAI